MAGGTMTVIETSPEQTRARYPDQEGYVSRDGVRVFYEVYGSGHPTILLLPTWSIIHSRHWKAQIPYLARHARVIAFDGRGNGRSDRPTTEEAYREHEFAADALAVLDATGTERAVIVGLSAGALWGALLAAEHPERVEAAAFIAAAAPFAMHAVRTTAPFDEPMETYEGWDKYNRHYWLEHYRDFLEFFFRQVFTEPHSTKQIEDCVGWGMETDGATLALTYLGRELRDGDAFRELCGRIACPVLVIHGTDDAVRPFIVAEELAEVTGGELAALEGSGHCPHARAPVRVNLLLRDFVAPRRPARWIRGRGRRK
ncbi:MAG: alpha/beta hydrolase, partial [Thermoleophilia bacterium]|nr:alpha/beta hydrolase [Thermoleophilia bacterium]